MNYYGIDLGTSNCLVAKLYQNLEGTFEVECLTDNEGEFNFPSVIFFNNENEYKVGKSAIKHLYTDTESTIELVKVRLGRTDFIQIKTPNKIFTKSPQEITSYLLSNLNSIYGNKIENGVITVPAFFDQSQKNATMQAGIIAEISPKLLIEEPTAAIMYHIFSEYKESGFDLFNPKEEKNVLVFDFGGGTLDLSLINIKRKNNEVIPQVLAIGGDCDLGGNIIDFVFLKVILNYLYRCYPNDTFINDVYLIYDKYFDNYIDNNILQFDNDVEDQIKQFIFRLKRNLEQVKIKLSTEESAVIVFEGNYKPITFTRDNFETNVLESNEINIYERIKDSLLEISKKRIKVDEVLLIGGSSQIPFVKNIITEVFDEMGIKEEKIKLSKDFSKAVVKGAAIQAAICSGVAVEPFMNNKCESIVARDIEIEHAGIHEIFIPMGVEYPFKEKKKFVIKIGHSLSEAVLLKFNEIINQKSIIKRKEICSFEFFLPIYYTGEEITIYMNIDDAGLYQIEAIHNATNEKAEFESNKKYSLTDEDIKKIVDNKENLKKIT